MSTGWEKSLGVQFRPFPFPQGLNFPPSPCQPSVSQYSWSWEVSSEGIPEGEPGPGLGSRGRMLLSHREVFNEEPFGG